MTHTPKSKPAGFKPGLVFLALFSFAMGALGVYGWLQSDMDQLTRLALASGAGATALVIPFTVIALGRSWASVGVIPVLLVAMAMQAVSFHNFVGVAIEAPHRAAFDAGLLPLRAEVTRATGLLDAASAALDAVEAPALPERCRQVACPNTIEANAKAYALALAPRQAAVEAAKADRAGAMKALSDAEAAYHPLAPDWAVWLVGGLLDLSIALAIWSLEATARRLRKEHEAKLETLQRTAREERARQRAIREKAKAKAAKEAAKARPAGPFVPQLVAANDR